MYCEKCGESLSNDAVFCSHCGARVASPAASPTLSYAATQAPRIADDRPVITLKPVFVGWVTLLSVVPIQLFMTVWAGGFFGGFSSILFKSLHLPMWIPFVFFACLAFFGIPGLAYFVKMRNYAKTEYRFYTDRLEYYDGFFIIRHKTVPYHNVQEIDLRRGFVQRRYGLGTIVLGTVVASMATRGSVGIRVADIESPDDVYERVKALVKITQTR